MTSLEQDLTDIIAPVIGDFIDADPELANLLQNLNLNSDQTTAFLAGLAANGHDELAAYSSTRVGIVSPDQSALPEIQALVLQAD